MNPQFDLQSLFGVQMAPGGMGYVQQVGNAPNALGDEASVMMISGAPGFNGLGSQATLVADPATGLIPTATGVALSLGNALRTPVTFLGITLPLWAWVGLIISGIGIAGWYFFIRK